MPLRKVVIFWGILLLLLLGNGLGWFNIVQVDAAPPVYHIALTTQTPTPKNTPNVGRLNSIATTSPTARWSEFMTYKIQAGDNIYLIAQKMYGESSKYSLILAANNINENTRLSVGMTLKIPVLPTPTATLTLLPSATATVAMPSATPTVIPSARSEITPTFDPKGVPTEEQIAIMNMLTIFATSTLVGSTLVCGFLAFVVYSHSRRIARQQGMARRIRPPLAH
jgi:hypothetical protein